MMLTCHCENIKIRVELPQQLTRCNCSICRRYQALWGYFSPGDIELEVGSSGIGTYLWGDQTIEFIHCKSCACVTHYRTIAGKSKEKVAVNFRMASVTLISDIPVRYFNGEELL